MAFRVGRKSEKITPGAPVGLEMLDNTIRLGGRTRNGGTEATGPVLSYCAVSAVAIQGIRDLLRLCQKMVETE
jgi:hypothetical protein